jgi:hypothetical protein
MDNVHDQVMICVDGHLNIGLIALVIGALL